MMLSMKGKKRKEKLAFLLMLCMLMTCITNTRMQVKADATQDSLHPDATLSYQDIDYGFTNEELGDCESEREVRPESTVYSLDRQGRTEEKLPVAYGVNAKGEITDRLMGLRNQGGYGNCWAYSALGASEACLIEKGYADTNIDLSERHLTYYFFEKGPNTTDSLGLTKGDYNSNVSTQSYWNVGGNSLLTIWQMASWCGPVAESIAPFSPSMSHEDENGLMGQENSTQMAYEMDAYHLQNAYVIPIGNSYADETQRDRVKKLIMQYGALGMSYYADKSTASFDNAQKNCYYNDTYTSTNHAIMVVGWDDRFPKENFNEGRQPEKDGAWLMRNSWGEEDSAKAQNGYFWLSYYDYSLRDKAGSTTKYAYVYDLESADNYDRIYQHDGDAGYKRLGNESGSYLGLGKAANVFCVLPDQEKTEYLDAVGIGESISNLHYTLYIYTNVTSEQDPTSGQLALSQSGILAYNGYHTIPLNTRVRLEPGSKYAVVFTFENNPAYVYASRNFTLSPWKFTSNNQEGQSFFVLYGQEEWLDCAKNIHTKPLALRIKAYSVFSDKVFLNEDVLTLDEEGDSQTLCVETIMENEAKLCGETQVGQQTVSGSGLLYAWQSSDETVAKAVSLTEERGRRATITAMGNGFCEIKVTNLETGNSARGFVHVAKESEDPFIIYTDETNSGSDPPKEEKPGSGGPEDNRPEDTKDEEERTDPPQACEEQAQLIGLSLDKTTVTTQVGKSVMLAAKPTYSPGKKADEVVYWKSSDEKIASVNACGEVTAKRPGKAVITVYEKDVKATCTVYVKPSKVTGVSLSLLEKKKGNIKWNTQKYIDGYEISRAKGLGSSYYVCKKVKQETKQSEKVTAFFMKNASLRSYHFRVRSYKLVDGKKLYSDWSKDVTLAPKKTTIVSAKRLRNKKIKLSYRKVSGASGYKIYRQEKGKKTYQLLAYVTDKNKTSFLDSTAKANKQYYYKVRAYRMVEGKRVIGALSDAVKVK